jgi:hypothetical protein
MWIIGVIGVLALVAIIGTALGQLWGPLLLALGFAGWGALLLLSGFRYPFPMIGVAYLMASVGELAAAWEFWQPASAEGPSASWRGGAALAGVLGALGAMGLLVVLAAAAVSAMII